MRFYANVPMPTPEQAKACLSVIYDEATLAQRVALYTPLVGTDYVPRSWLNASLFILAGGKIEGTKAFRTKLVKYGYKRDPKPDLAQATA